MEYNITYREKDKGLQAIISYKDNGKWKQKSKQGFEDSRKGKNEAKEWVKNTLNDLENIIKVNNDFANITYKEFINEFLDFKKSMIEYNTYLFYKFSLEKFKLLNDIGVTKITPIHIRKAVDDVKKEGKKSIKQYYNILNALFISAIKDFNIITTNPCTPINDKNSPEEKEPLTLLEQKKLMEYLSTCENVNVYIVSEIALKCGLRMGEILGLTWDHVDLKNKTIEVVRQWKKNKDKSYGFGSLKTSNSNRIVPIPNNTVKVLSEYKECYPRRIDNRIVGVNNISEYCRRYYRHIGIKNSLHGLRHTYATNLVANGVDFKTVAFLMGHDIEMTMKIYSHVTTDMLDRAKSIINNF